LVFLILIIIYLVKIYINYTYWIRKRDMLKVENLVIADINGINNFHIKFNPNFNIICGPNGIGKTTILKCIKSSFALIRDPQINPSSNRYRGSWSIFVNKDGQLINRDFFMEKTDFSLGIRDSELNNRDLRINPHGEFIEFNVQNRYLNALSGRARFESITRWLVKNYFSDQISYEQYKNVSLLKECFYQIDPSISFSRIVEVDNKHNKYESLKNSTLNENMRYRNLLIMVNTPEGEIPFKNLSSGYISCLSIILGIIQLVERGNKYMSLQEFNGLIIIDEIDLHLHPEWQNKILSLIRWLVPNAQIIVTTHSPHIIQAAKSGEIIALEKDEFINQTIIRQVPESMEYGYQGWTIEEILIDVMGLKNPMSETFIEVLKKFENAQKYNDLEEMKRNFSSLKKMLHPRNPLLKMLSIQSGEINIWEALNVDKIN
ncbi:AAA family ATPase, partial [Neobacillus drentensis]|uniref:AAA family ATPase n=1 Tax=Neobacillus drentensis TaxID=220684 RepID=UPI002FFEE274